MSSSVGHVSRKAGNTGRFIATESAIGRVAKRTSTANAAAGADVGVGGRDGTAAWTAPHGEGAAHGLHAVEGAVAGDSAGARRSTPGFLELLTAPATGST